MTGGGGRGATPRGTVGRVLLVLGVCLILLGGAGVWFLYGRATAPACNGLPEDERVQKSVGVEVRAGMSCAAFGELLVKVTTSDGSGRHTQGQAQALKDVLFTLGFSTPDELVLDPALRMPLATAVADYAPDLHEMLAGLDGEYVRQAGRQTPPWESDGTYHLAVYNTVLRKVLREVAQDPHAYALLRVTETRTAAQRLATVLPDATGYALTVPPTANARGFGILDGIGDAVTHGQDKDRAVKWRRAVMERLLSDPTTPHTYQDGPASYLTATWLQDLKNTPEKERPDRLRTQGVDMARAWAEARKTDEQTRQGLLAKVERSGLSAYREIEP